MKLKNRLFQKSIFCRLILTFLTIITPIYLLGVGIHQLGVSIIRKEIINSMESQITYHKISFDEEMFRMLRLLSECMSDEDLLKLSNIPQSMGDFEKAQSYNRLESRMYTLKNSSIYIEDTKAIIPILNRTVSANDGVIPISEEDFAIYNNFPSYFNVLDKTDEKLFLRVRSLALGGRKPNYILQIELSNEMIVNTIELFNDYKDSGSLFYYPEQDFILSTLEDSPVIESVKNGIVESDKDSFLETINVDGTKYLVFFRQLEYNDIWLVAYVPESQVFIPFRIYMYLLWVFTVISALIILYFSFSTHNFLQRPLKKLVEAFHNVESGELKFVIEHSTNDEFRYIYNRFNAMLDYINTLIEQVYLQRVMTQKAELKQLQSQINPHFFYNSFFILQKMVQRDEKESAVKFSNYLAKYFQYVTRNQNDEIALSKEVDHAKNYLEIQTIRFPNAKVEFEELPDKYKNMQVPRLILQPIIENIFEHGFTKSIEHRNIIIKFFDEQEGLYCVVEDNGNNIDGAAIEEINEHLDKGAHDSEITGLLNVHMRIKMKFGANSGLKIAKSDLGGFKVTILFENAGGEKNK